MDAVRILAAPWGVDARRLFETTGGNPFFVTEALAATGVELPDTVRGAVLARAARLSPPARALLEAAAVVPSRIELWLLDAVADLSALDECLNSGMLRPGDGVLEFRHELARLAIEVAISPHRRVALHLAVLGALASSARGPVDPARLSHHAAAASDVDAVLRYAPEAGERAAALCAHREAAEQFAKALRYAAMVGPERRAYLFERRSYECYLTEQIVEAIEARRAGARRCIACRETVFARETAIGGCRGWRGSLVTGDRGARGPARGRVAGDRAARPRARDGIQQSGPAVHACR